jgi:hypothetical protein
MTTEPGETPSDRPTAPDSVVLTGQQFALVQALQRLGPASDRPLQMYREALHALRREDSPESLHVAGYEVREMMNALPALMGVSPLPHRELSNEARVFSESWSKHATTSGCHDGGQWSGQIDSPLKKFLRKAGAFVEWFGSNVRTRRQESAAMFGKFPEGDLPTPQALREMSVEQWGGLLYYFNTTTHHDALPSRQEFLKRLSELEALLLAHISPKTVDDQDAIDALIAEAEAR